MNTYVYIDNLKQEVIYECERESIVQADEDYKAFVGKDPSKQSHVGCRIVQK